MQLKAGVYGLVDSKRVLILDKEYICFCLRVRIVVLNLSKGVNGKKGIYLPKSSTFSFTRNLQPRIKGSTGVKRSNQKM